MSRAVARHRAVIRYPVALTSAVWDRGYRKRRVHAVYATVRGALTGDNGTYARFSRCTERGAPAVGLARAVTKESAMWQSLLDLLTPTGVAPRRL